MQVCAIYQGSSHSVMDQKKQQGEKGTTASGFSVNYESGVGHPVRCEAGKIWELCDSRFLVNCMFVGLYSPLPVRYIYHKP